MNVYVKAAKETLKDGLKATATIVSILAVIAAFVFLIAYAPWVLVVVAILGMLGGAYLERLKEAKEEVNE